MEFTKLTDPSVILGIDARIRKIHLANRKIRAYMRRKISNTRWDEKEEWILNSIIVNLAKESEDLSVFIQSKQLEGKYGS